MFGWGESQDAYQQVYQQGGGYDNPNPDHQGKFSHELLAGGASFAAFHEFEEHQRKEGKPVNHEFAKELLAGFAGGEIDKLAETHGMNEYDKERAKHQARENASNMYDQHYGGQDQYDPNQYGPPRGLQDQYQSNYGYGGDNGGY